MTMIEQEGDETSRDEQGSDEESFDVERFVAMTATEPPPAPC